MNVLKNISYRPSSDDSGLCDLFIPEQNQHRDVVVMTIHGGGWCSMAKENLEGISQWLCHDMGLSTCNINYRLSSAVPWPACGDDCLTAARFLLNDDKMISGEPARRKIIIVGASSGGHLALMTGLRLPAEKVVAVVSISGIGDMKTDQALSPERYKILFSHEPSDAEIRDASPATYLKPDSPPILCTHTPKDNVVPIQSAQVFLDAVHRNGTIGESYYYEKEETGYSHRIWIPGSSPHKLYPEIEAAIASFIKNCLMLNAEC